MHSQRRRLSRAAVAGLVGLGLAALGVLAFLVALLAREMGARWPEAVPGIGMLD